MYEDYVPLFYQTGHVTTVAVGRGNACEIGGRVDCADRFANVG